jgi:hypothetical protein
VSPLGDLLDLVEDLDLEEAALAVGLGGRAVRTA